MIDFPYGLFDLAGGVREFTTGNYVTGSGSAVDAYTPTDAGAGFGANLLDMFSTDAVEYTPYFDAYPNVTAITTGGGSYGLNSSAITSNPNWGIYASKLGLGQAIFEAAQWSDATAGSITAANPWFVRGGYSDSVTGAGVESVSNANGGPGSPARFGSRPLVLVLRD